MEVIWSNMATKHLESILEYVVQEFGDIIYVIQML